MVQRRITKKKFSFPEDYNHIAYIYPYTYNKYIIKINFRKIAWTFGPVNLSYKFNLQSLQKVSLHKKVLKIHFDPNWTGSQDQFLVPPSCTQAIYRELRSEIVPKLFSPKQLRTIASKQLNALYSDRQIPRYQHPKIYCATDRQYDHHILQYHI